MKSLKTISAIFLTLAMLLSMSGVIYSETRTIINDDFENAVSSSVWTGDYEIESGLNPCLKSAADKTQFYCRLDRTVTKGAMVISYDVMLPELSNIRIKQVWDAASGGKRAYLIQSTATGKLTIENAEIGTYMPSEWFNLTEVVDIDQKKTAIYLNGSYVNEYAWRANREAVGINNIQTQYDKKEISVDNVYVAAYGYISCLKESCSGRNQPGAVCQKRNYRKLIP